MAIREGEPHMGDSHTNFFENPRFNFLHRNKKTVTLSTGEKIPVVRDINLEASYMVDKEMEIEREKPLVQERKPLMGGLRRALTGIINGAIKS